MTEEERVKKWSRGISEMDELSMEEKKIVCHQTAMQMVILWGTLEVIVIGFLVWAAFQYPEIIPSFNRITDLVNSNFEHSGTRAKRIGAIIGQPACSPSLNRNGTDSPDRGFCRMQKALGQKGSGEAVLSMAHGNRFENDTGDYLCGCETGNGAFTG
ncbi:hypothetical protein [Acidaminococcus massiliensis]|uniref:hypothetical protein n=1 Tax=Acidaminococcus massiliensis TaxID=1852375 RepID=UPI0022E3F672|nr:hypothetical protein [Acidaminococcus massiliensis]